MTDQEKKRIEDFINKYRTYPPEYTGVRDPKIIQIMYSQYRFDCKTRTVTQAEGRINEEGNFEIVDVYQYPIDDPTQKVAVGFGFFDWKFVRNRYNKLMMDLGYPGNTIGTGFSDNTDQWNLRDMVSEVEYIRSTFYEVGHPNNQMRTEDPKQWKSFTTRIHYFLRKYRDQIDGLVAYKKHNSKYDN